MRWLFNHGLTSSELYAGSDLEFIDKDANWFKENLGIIKSTAYDYFGYIFSVSFKMVIEKIIKERKRFWGPKKWFYIDFEIFLEDEFILQRRRGRMQDIDIIQSDFTGYQLSFFYKSSYRETLYRQCNIYLGKKMNEVLLDEINKGEKLYSIEDFSLNDIWEELHFLFPRLPIKELKKIVTRGYYRMYQCIKSGCYLTFNNAIITTFIGTFYKNPAKQFSDYSFRMRKKLMKIAKWRGDKFDQYYYVGISESRMPEWVKLNDKSERAGWRWVHFEDVIARRQREAVIYNAPKIYIFRVKLQKKYSKKWNHKIDKAKYRDVEYVGKGHNYKFLPAVIHWKELIKEWNEKGDS